MAERSVCDVDSGKVTIEGEKTMQECALLCNKKSSGLFFVSRQDTGYCHGNKCLCYCYPGLFQDGTCQQKSWGNDDLYRIKTKTNAIKGNFYIAMSFNENNIQTLFDRFVFSDKNALQDINKPTLDM